MKTGEMAMIARLIRRVLLDREAPASIAREVGEVAAVFRDVRYCFDRV
jgi:hypothetical protein